MAVTIQSTPKEYSPSDNPLTYTFSSDQTAQANFSFVIETYFNTVKVGEDRVFVESFSYGHIDISSHIKPLISAGGKLLTVINEIPVGSINIKVYESYGTTPTLQANSTSGVTKVWKACIAQERFITEDFDTTYKQIKWLTNQPNDTFKVPVGNDVYLTMLNGVGTTHWKIDYKTAVASLGTVEADTTFEIMQINANSVLNGFPTATYAIVSNDDDTPFRIDFMTENCENFNVVYWVNEYGAIDQYTFDHSEESSGTSVSEGYSRAFGAWSGTNFNYTSSAGQRNNIVTTTRKITLNSGYMSSLTQNWLNEVVQSPRHWIYLLPWTLTNASFTDEDDRFEDLISYSLSFNHIFLKDSPTV